MSGQRVDLSDPSYMRETEDDVLTMIEAVRPALVARNTVTSRPAVESVPIVSTPPNTPAPPYEVEVRVPRALPPEPARAVRRPLRTAASPYTQFGMGDIRQQVRTRPDMKTINTRYSPELNARYEAKLLEFQNDGMKMTREQFQGMAMAFWLNHLDYQRDHAPE